MSVVSLVLKATKLPNKFMVYAKSTTIHYATNSLGIQCMDSLIDNLWPPVYQYVFPLAINKSGWKSGKGKGERKGRAGTFYPVYMHTTRSL